MARGKHADIRAVSMRSARAGEERARHVRAGMGVCVEQRLAALLTESGNCAKIV